jgi:methionine-rich copper-binding protein CopC
MLNKLFATRNRRIIFWVIIIIAIGAFFWLTAPRAMQFAKNQANAPSTGTLSPSANTPANSNINAPKQPSKKTPAKATGFTEKKTPHFVSSSIANNAIISQVPSFLTLNFDAPLAKSTQAVLTVKKDDITNATFAPSIIQDNKLIVQLNPQVTDGKYYVYYVACFADTGCRDGRFGYDVKLPK